MAIASINPSTGITEQVFEPHTPDEVEARLAAASTAVTAMRATTFATRAEWMNTSADLLEAEVDTVAEMMTREMGKTLASARAEALKSVKNMRFYATNAEHFLADET
ncbi:MAG TPA: aldehyde dehydrogenase family protein, partial [Aeromicrobium sp.]|nr:aldehyde dehydrogenase family protein [Aeromicrobium sp.]